MECFYVYVYEQYKKFDGIMEMIIMYNLIYRELLLDRVVVYCLLFVNKVCNVLFDGSISYVNDYKKWEMNKNKFMM